MSVALEFIDFVVRIDAIREKYPGGLEQCKEDHREAIGRRIWFDDHLWRDGAMNPNDIHGLVEHWESLGFQGNEVRDGVKHWKDFCVVEGIFGGVTLPCDWIVVEDGFAYLKGTEPGAVAGRHYDAAAMAAWNR